MKSTKRIRQLASLIGKSARFNNGKRYITQQGKNFFRWCNHWLVPTIHAKSGTFFESITFEEGSSQWTALRPSNRWSQYIIWTLVGVAGFGITWSMFARIDETVQAVGKLEPVGATIDIKAPLGGVIKNILVKEGELVKKDQILIEVDTTAARARLEALIAVRSRTVVDLLLSKNQLGQEIDTSGLTINQLIRLSSLREELESRTSASKNGIEKAEEQLNSNLAQLKAKRKSLMIRERILNDIEPLSSEGAISRSQYLKELQEVELLRGEVKSLEASVRMARAGIKESINKLKNTTSLSKIDFSTKVEETEKQLSQLDNQISEAKVTLKYQALRAPKDGIVFDLQANSAGYVANNERPVLKIVPVDKLIARVFLANKDIGFIKPGQESKVRVDAYPYNEFGELSGKIKSIGSDVLEPDAQFNYYRFPVTISLASDELTYKGKKLPLTAGMSVNANIILRQRPVIAIFTQKVLPFWDSLEKL